MTGCFSVGVLAGVVLAYTLLAIGWLIDIRRSRRRREEKQRLFGDNE